MKLYIIYITIILGQSVPLFSQREGGPSARETFQDLIQAKSDLNAQKNSLDQAQRQQWMEQSQQAVLAKQQKEQAKFSSQSGQSQESVIIKSPKAYKAPEAQPFTAELTPEQKQIQAGLQEQLQKTVATKTSVEGSAKLAKIDPVQQQAEVARLDAQVAQIKSDITNPARLAELAKELASIGKDAEKNNTASNDVVAAVSTVAELYPKTQQRNSIRNFFSTTTRSFKKSISDFITKLSTNLSKAINLTKQKLQDLGDSKQEITEQLSNVADQLTQASDSAIQQSLLEEQVQESSQLEAIDKNIDSLTQRQTDLTQRLDQAALVKDVLDKDLQQQTLQASVPEQKYDPASDVAQKYSFLNESQYKNLANDLQVLIGNKNASSTDIQEAIKRSENFIKEVTSMQGDVREAMDSLRGYYARSARDAGDPESIKSFFEAENQMVGEKNFSSIATSETVDALKNEKTLAKLGLPDVQLPADFKRMDSQAAKQFLIDTLKFKALDYFKINPKNILTYDSAQLQKLIDAKYQEIQDAFPQDQSVAGLTEAQKTQRAAEYALLTSTFRQMQYPIRNPLSLQDYYTYLLMNKSGGERSDIGNGNTVNAEGVAFLAKLPLPIAKEKFTEELWIDMMQDVTSVRDKFQKQLQFYKIQDTLLPKLKEKLNASQKK